MPLVIRLGFNQPIIINEGLRIQLKDSGSSGCRLLFFGPKEFTVRRGSMPMPLWDNRKPYCDEKYTTPKDRRLTQEQVEDEQARLQIGAYI